MLTEEEQTLVGPIPFAGMPTDRAGLRGILRVNLDRHTLMQQRFVGDHGVQFSKGPLGIGDIGLSLLFARFFAPPSFRSVSDIGQVLQAQKRVRMSTHESLTHDMIGVGFQPSLPSTHHHQAAGSGTGAFSLQTLSQACVMIGLLNDAFPGMEGLLTPSRSGYCQIAQTHVYTDDAGMRFGSWRLYFHVQGDEQIELLAGLVIPQFRRPDMSAALYQSNMLGIRRVGKHNAALQGQDAHTVLSLETVVMPKLIGQSRRDKLGSLVQALIAFLGHTRLALCSVLPDLRPQGFVGGSHLTGDTTGHLSRYLEASAYLIVGAILQPDLVAHLAVLKCVAGDIVQTVTIGQLGRSQRFELGGIGMQFELSGQCYLHHLSIIVYLMKVVKWQRYPSALSPNEERRIPPRN